MGCAPTKVIDLRNEDKQAQNIGVDIGYQGKHNYQKHSNQNNVHGNKTNSADTAVTENNNLDATRLNKTPAESDKVTLQSENTTKDVVEKNTAQQSTENSQQSENTAQQSKENLQESENTATEIAGNKTVQQSEENTVQQTEDNLQQSENTEQISGEKSASQNLDLILEEDRKKELDTSAKDTAEISKMEAEDIMSKNSNKSDEKEKEENQSDEDDDDDDDDDNDDDDNNDKPKKKKTKKTKEKPVKLTKEDIDRIRANGLEEVKKFVTILTNMNSYLNEEGQFRQAYKFAAFRLMQLHFILKSAPLAEHHDYQRAEGKIISEYGGVTALCDVVIYCLEKGYKNSEGKLIMAIWSPLINTSVALLNFSDMNPTLVGDIVEHPRFLEFCADFIQKNQEEHMEQTLSQNDTRILMRFMSIIHNIAQAEDHTEPLRNAGFVEIFVSYLESPKSITVLTAISTLADLVDENEAQKLEAKKDFLTVLMKFLTKALANKKRRYLGWSAREIGRTVRRIARNDTNKKSLVDSGSIPLLVKLSKGADVEEKREGVGALWTLSFNEGIQEKIIKEFPEVIEIFLNLRESEDKQTKKASTGALWNMRELLAKSEKYKEISNSFIKRENTMLVGGHVMISYQWGNQAIMKEIRDVLRKNKIKVWMDIDEMAGSTLASMARAVEDADIVLLCYSQKYKDSNNCRSEAEYAYELKKHIIPLKMERNYKPDGWLGFILGTKLFYEFSGKYTFESRMDGLLKDIYKKLKKDVPDSLVIPQNVLPVASQPQGTNVAATIPATPRAKIVASATVKKWTNVEVTKWIDKHGLSQKQFGHLSGLEIAFLQVLRQESPDNFYKTLNGMLKISDLLTLAKFTFALEDTHL